LAKPGAWLAALLACFVLLGGTGVWLAARYRPDVSSVVVANGRSGPRIHGGGRVDDLHRVLAVAAVIAAAGLVLSLAQAVGQRRRGAGAALWLSAAATVAVLVGIVSGYRLPWFSLALSAVRVDLNLRGVWSAAFNPIVRFVITKQGERTQSTYRSIVLIHLFAVPAVVAISGLAIFVVARRRRSS
jgi:quinol-cytochrome oxidoreductase complex cytochrome b subunit